MRLTLDYPPVWLVVAIIGVWALAQMVPGGFGGLGRWPGTALILLGLALMILAGVEMMRARTTVVPHNMPSALVTTGVFRYSRNPIYLGDVLVLLGFVLRWDVAVGLVMVPVFMGVITKRFIRDEEARLRTTFGAAYDDWAAGTRRWI